MFYEINSSFLMIEKNNKPIENIEELYNLAFKYIQSEKYEEAIEIYDTAISINPSYADVYNNKGCALYYLKKYEEAIKVYDSAISINPNHAYVYNNKGCALYYLKKYEEAIEVYDKAISINPKHLDVYNNKGNALYQLKKYEEAIKVYDTTIFIKPNHPDAYYSKGNALYHLEKYEEAIDVYDKAISIKPNYTRAYNNKGSALGNLRKYDKAIEVYDKAISINPNYKLAYNNKSIAFINVEKKVKSYDITDEQKLVVEDNNENTYITYIPKISPELDLNNENNKKDDSIIEKQKFVLENEYNNENTYITYIPKIFPELDLNDENNKKDDSIIEKQKFILENEYNNENTYITYIPKISPELDLNDENNKKDDSIIDITNENLNLTIERNKQSDDITDKIPDSSLTNRKVVDWEMSYIYSHTEIRYASKEQKKFYYYFKKCFYENKFVDLEGNTNYAFILFFELIERFKKHKDLDLLEKEFKSLGNYCAKTRHYGLSFLIDELGNKKDEKSLSKLDDLLNPRYLFKNGLSDYDPDEGKLWKKYEDKIELNKQEKNYLNFKYKDNAFSANEIHCLEIIKTYLLLMSKLDSNLKLTNSSITKEIDYLKKQIIKINKVSSLESKNYYSLQIEERIYLTLFKRVENAVREAHEKRKIADKFPYYELNLNKEFEKRLGLRIEKVIKESKVSINKPNLKDVSNIKRKKIEFNKDEILLAEQNYNKTVELLNEYLEEEEKTEVNSTSNLTITEKTNAIVNIDNNKKLFIDELSLNKVQEDLITKIAQNSFKIEQHCVETYSLKVGMFKNQLIDSINDACYEFLGDEVLIEEEDNFYIIEESYYNSILK